MAIDRASPATRTRNRRGQGSLLRDDLLSAARLIQSQQGEAAVTIRAVTRVAGVVPQSFYLQFSTLSELLFALYSSGHDQLRGQLEAALSEASSDATNRLREVARAYLLFAQQQPGLYRSLMEAAGQAHPEWDSGKLPGSASFDLLGGLVSALHPELQLDPARLFVVTTSLWTRLHGLASLRINRPAFPWPDIERLLDQLLAETLAG